MRVAQPFKVALVDLSGGVLEVEHFRDQAGTVLAGRACTEFLELDQDGHITHGRRQCTDDWLQIGRVGDEVLDDKTGFEVAAGEPLAGDCVEMIDAIEASQANGENANIPVLGLEFHQITGLDSRGDLSVDQVLIMDLSSSIVIVNILYLEHVLGSL